LSIARSKVKQLVRRNRQCIARRANKRQRTNSKVRSYEGSYKDHSMFHRSSSAFAPDLTALRGRVRALENDIERLGRKAGRRASTSLSAAGDRASDAVAAALDEILDRLRSGGRMAGDEAMRFGNDAAALGVKVGNDALRRVADEIEYRPLTMLAVAVGVGILIGMAGAKSRH
jgi:polyhydroxyalkanoate synthesis regulator phasin